MIGAHGAFTVPPAPARVVFGAGSLSRLPELVEEQGATRVLLLASSGRGTLVRDVSALLASRVAGVEHRAVMHVPAELAEQVVRDTRAVRADLVIAMGGGSAIGMAKAIALHDGPACIAVPTTYSGSEMTAVWGITRGGEKTTGRDERVRPRAVLYDPLLTLPLPPAVSGASALNALAHGMEALYAPDANPVSSLCAAEGIGALARALGRVVAAPDDLAARTELLYGAWLAGTALGHTTMGLHHKLCHTLGGTFGLPHAETHAVMLPYTIAYNAPAADEAMRTAAAAIGASDHAAVPRALHALLQDIGGRTGIARSLRALGLAPADLERAADLAVARPYPNPRPVTRDGVLALLHRAFEGEAP